MAVITIIKYQAFDRLHTAVYQLGESFAQIHEHLTGICDTYEVAEIMQCAAVTNIPVIQLTDIKNAIMNKNILEVHATCINGRVFISTLVEVAPKVAAAYSITADTISEYMINRCVEKKDKLTPQRANQLFPGMQDQGFIYEV